VSRLANSNVQSLLGAIDYWRFPEKRNTWNGPFNGQESRARLFLSLINKTNARAIVETGTFRGNTTAFMARTALPIYTVENYARNYGFARMRLFRNRNVTLRLGDSRKMLREWLRGPLRQCADQTVFVGRALGSRPATR
jgi:predicted O-methyltransferase YrrM